WHTIFVVASCVLLARGLRGGIEAGTRALMLMALLLLFFLVIFAATHDVVPAAAAIWWRMDWSELGWKGVLEALRQAIFSAGLGLGIMITFGGYVPERTRLLPIAALVLILATAFAIVAGSIVVGIPLS